MCVGAGGGGGGIMGWARAIFFREKGGGAKREFHDDWGSSGSLCVLQRITLTTIHVEDLNKF